MNTTLAWKTLISDHATTPERRLPWGADPIAVLDFLRALNGELDDRVEAILDAIDQGCSDRRWVREGDAIVVWGTISEGCRGYYEDTAVVRRFPAPWLTLDEAAWRAAIPQFKADALARLREVQAAEAAERVRQAEDQKRQSEARRVLAIDRRRTQYEKLKREFEGAP